MRIYILNNCYTGINVRVQWGGIVSEYFLACNSMKQGGVLRPHNINDVISLIVRVRSIGHCIKIRDSKFILVLYCEFLESLLGLLIR